MSIMLIQKLRQQTKAVRRHLVCHGKSCRTYIYQAAISLPVLCRKPLAVRQKPETQSLPAHHRAQRRPGRLKVHKFHALQGDGDHWILPPIVFAQLPVPGYFQPFKQRRIAPVSEKIFQHAHVQGLAEPPGTGEKVHHASTFQQFPDKARLIYIVIFTTKKILKILHTDGQHLFRFHLQCPPLIMPAYAKVLTRLHYKEADSPFTATLHFLRLQAIPYFSTLSMSSCLSLSS